MRPESVSYRERLVRMAAEYLEPNHIDKSWDGCVIASLATEVASARSEEFRELYSDEMLQMILNIAQLKRPEDDPEQYEQAIAFLAMV